MPKNLQADFESAQKAIDEILSKAETEDRPLTDEEKATLKGHEDSRDAAKREIDERNAVALARKRQQDASAWATSPQGRVTPAGPPPRQDEAKVPAFLARKHAAATLKAFAGPDAQDEAYYAGRWLAAACFRHKASALWCEQHQLPLDWHADSESLVATEGSNVKGGYLVPPVFSNAIIRLRDTYGVMRQNADIVPMSSDTIQIPRETGDVTAYFVGEGVEITASDSAYDAITLTARKTGALCKVSTELAEDAFASMADRIATSFGYAFAKQEDDCGFLGTGALATYGGITGLITAVGEGSEYAAASGNTAFSTLDLADFEGMLGMLPSYVRDIRWYVSKPAAWASMFRLQDAAGGNNQQNIAGGPNTATFLGYPVVFVPSMNAVLTAQTSTEGLCYVGDMRQAVKFGDRRTMTIASSVDRYFELDLIGIRCTQRWDLNCANVGSASAAGSLVMLSTPGS